MSPQKVKVLVCKFTRTL